MRGIHSEVRRIGRGVVALLAVALLLLPGLSVSAQASGGVGGRVANPDPDNPRSKSIFIYTLTYGESKQDQLLVVNPTDEDQTVLLASVDGVVTNTGSYTCRMEAEPIEDSGGWVKLSKNKVTVPAGGQEKVDFEVSVPADADVGEHNSCLTLRVVGDEGGEVNGGVRLRTRPAIRMIVTIPGDLRRDLSISQFSIDLGNEAQRYTMAVANRGNVSADIDMRVRLTSLIGQEVVNVGGEYPVVPGEALTQQFTSEFAPLFGGWYYAAPSIRYDKRLGAFGTGSTTAEYETITGEAVTIFLWPTMLGWLILMAILILVAVIIWRTTGRVKRQRQLRNGAKTHTVTKEDTIQTLAKKAKVSWQELARLNKIKAPYTLEVGQKILLPVIHADITRRKVTKKR